MQHIDSISNDIFVEQEEEKKEKIDGFGKRYEGMKRVEEALNNMNELKNYENFYFASLLIQNLQYSKARESLENCYTDTEELLLLKTFVYNKLQILTSHEICLNMLSEEYQKKYQMLVAKDCGNQVVIEECNKIKTAYQATSMTFLECKKLVWKEMLLKANDSLKYALCEHVAYYIYSVN